MVVPDKSVKLSRTFRPYREVIFRPTEPDRIAYGRKKARSRRA